MPDDGLRVLLPDTDSWRIAHLLELRIAKRGIQSNPVPASVHPFHYAASDDLLYCYPLLCGSSARPGNFAAFLPFYCKEGDCALKIVMNGY